MMSAPAVLRSCAEFGIIPDNASISRNGEARWEGGGVYSVAWLLKGGEGDILWYVNTGDSRLGPLLKEFGGLSAWIRPLSEGGIGWPESKSGIPESVLAKELGQAVSFIQGRADLCSVLAETADVIRGDVRAWLPAANYPARLVQALIIGRDARLKDLETVILERLSEPGVASSARQWARQYSDALGIDVEV